VVFLSFSASSTSPGALTAGGLFDRTKRRWPLLKRSNYISSPNWMQKAQLLNYLKLIRQTAFLEERWLEQFQAARLIMRQVLPTKLAMAPHFLFMKCQPMKLLVASLRYRESRPERGEQF
jgi:hypothetical protein